jgi:DNA adenine methylase
MEEKHLAPVLCRVGSKRRFAELLTHILPPHRTYVEAFAGSAAIFFYKQPSEREVLNDLDKTVVNIFRDIQRIPANVEIPDLDTPEKIIAFHKKEVHTPIDRLVQNLIRACGGWMGKPVLAGNTLQTFPNPLNRLKYLKQYKARLKGVHITNEDYEKVISDNDSSDTVFFFDPPYEKSKDMLYAKGSATFDFQRFANVVSRIKGKWLITINDSKYIRDLFKGFNIVPVIILGHHQRLPEKVMAKTIGSDDRPELLISNYALPRDAPEFAPKSLRFS